MFLRDHEDEGRAVWLSEEEVGRLLDSAADTNEELAYALGLRCGLRSEEITEVTPDHLVSTDAGWMLRVLDGKGGKYRQTPVPEALAGKIETADEYREEPSDYPLVDSSSSGAGVATRTLRRWLESTREELAESDDPQWVHLSMHDLRRTWATNLRAEGVSTEIVMEWGGWSKVETFLDHYRDAYSPEAQRQERQKVTWL